MLLMEECDALAMDLGNRLERRKVKMVRVFMGEPDVVETLVGDRRGRAVESGAIVDDLSFGPGIGPDTGGLGLQENTRVIDEGDFHDSLKDVPAVMMWRICFNSVNGRLNFTVEPTM